MSASRNPGVSKYPPPNANEWGGGGVLLAGEWIEEKKKVLQRFNFDCKKQNEEEKNQI